MAFRFAIVGAGLTGTSMLYQFFQRLEIQAKSGRVEPRRVHVRVFDKQSVAGPGFPHNGRIVEPYHITNMCAEEMGILYAHPRDFIDWIQNHRVDLKSLYPAHRAVLSDPADHRNACSHYPRALMGEYLKARFADALRIAEVLGARVDVHTQCEVIDITENEQGASIYARSDASHSPLCFMADRVLLATGHWPRGESDRGYFSTPWPAQKLMENIPPGARVAVIGSSLSAIETALSLTSDGRFFRRRPGDLEFNPPPQLRQITLLSRHGLLPKVRSHALEYHPRFFTLENLQKLLAKHSEDLTLDAIFHLLEREIKWATKQAPDWQDVLCVNASPIELLKSSLDQTATGGGLGPNALWQSILRQAFPVIRELYLALAIAERMRFDRDYSTFFFAHAATQPPINAEKMLALLRIGAVRLVKLGRNYRFTKKPSGLGYGFVYGENELMRTDFRYVVDARGQERSVRTDGSQLYRNLILHKTIHLGEIYPIQTRGRDQAGVAGSALAKSHEVATESVWIDPNTHRIMQVDPQGTVRTSKYLYAVGAMTRGQIIDVSMARGLTRSTDRVAEQLVNWLIRHPVDRAEDDSIRSTE